VGQCRTPCEAKSPAVRTRVAREIKLRRVVGAPGFEPGASCAQGRIASLAKSFLFNHAVENKARCFVPHMCVDVRRCSRLIIGSLQKSLQFLLRKGTGA
jgi:hypothetical protein